MNISQFAVALKMLPTVLLEQLVKAGVNKTTTNDLLTEQDKTRLLDYLFKAHGESAPKSKITLTRKQTEELPSIQTIADQLPSEQVTTPHSALSGHYIDHHDGTVTDTTTGLMWMRFAEGQDWSSEGLTGQAKKINLDQVRAIRRDFAGYSDWRLPTVDELKSIVDPSRSNPAFDSPVFLGYNKNSLLFWSSNHHGAPNSREGYYVSFYSGSSFACHGEAINLVRLVRNTTFVGITDCGDEGPATEPPESKPSTNEPTESLIMEEAKTMTENIAAVVPDLDIGIAFESVESTSMKNGEPAYIIYTTITNQLKKQVRVELPLSDYVTAWGEQIEQDVWLSGLLIGANSTSIRAGAFKRAGVIFYQPKLRGISQGDRLYMSVVLSPSSRQFNFCFLCTDQTKRTFTLIEASMGDEAKYEAPSEQQTVGQASSFPAGLDASSRVTEIIERLESLETQYVSSLNRMERLLESSALNGERIGAAVDLIKQQPMSIKAEIIELRSLLGDAVQGSMQKPNSTLSTSQPTVSFQTYASLPLLLHGLSDLEAISLADLRRHLLPLDLLPNAVIEEINEKAFDLVGEPALEEDGEQVIVFREVLTRVLETWDTPSV